MSEPEWLQLESDPNMMNKLLNSLGVQAKWEIFDIISLDEEYLNTISKSVLGVILIFPYTMAYKDYSANLNKQLKDMQQDVDPEVFFMHQTIHNACGTIAIVHAIANNMQHLDFSPKSIVLKFIKNSILLDPKEKARLFEKDAGIKQAHYQAIVGLNNSEAASVDSPEEDEIRTKSQNNHFLTFVNVNLKLYELDGYKDIPVCHGPTTKETFLKDAVKICQEYIERDPKNFNFGVLALGESESIV